MIIKRGKIKGIRYNIIYNEDYHVYCLAYYHVHRVKDFFYRCIVLYWNQYQFYAQFWYRSNRKDKPKVFKTLLGKEQFRSNKRK